MGKDRDVDPRDAVRERLDRGEWLRIGDLMVLFGASRSMVDRWLREGARFPGKRLVIHYKITPGGMRECNPDDVRAVLAEANKIRSADDPLGEADSTS